MPRTIKRYENRKLYDTEASSYVSQQGVAELVRAGETVRVVDNATGEDLMAQTLTQIMLEEGKSGSGPGFLPTELLHGLLRRSGAAFDEGARQVSRRFSQAKSGLDDLLQQSFARLNRLTRSPSDPDGDEQTEHEPATASEVDALHEQLTRLEARLADVLDRVEDDGAPSAPPTGDTTRSRTAGDGS